MAKESTSTSGPRLVIVESPSKAKTINKYLGKDYIVKASVGHVRDLPSKNPKGIKAPVPGVDLENNFHPTYEISSDKKKVIAELKKLAKTASEIFLATDLDREGEAIAWHLAETLKLDSKTTKRVEFNEITKKAIASAFETPRTIDIDRVDAQQARRILDRIVGYMASPYLWKKVGRGLSAGRVQSVAVRLLTEREDEIRRHQPDESWKINALLHTSQDQQQPLSQAYKTYRDDNPKLTTKALNAWLASKDAFQAELIEVNNQKCNLGAKADERHSLEKPVTTAAEAAGIENITLETTLNDGAKGRARSKSTIVGTLASNVTYRVKDIETKPRTVKPSAPFITSTLQMAASSAIGIPPSRTMRAAQKLYEAGHITYMRTDATNLSADAVKMARTYIKEEYGQTYLPAQANLYSSSNVAAQEAHEAIRPTQVRTLHAGATADEKKLYDLIWKRFVACQMVPAKWLGTTILFERTDKQTGAILRSTGRMLDFDGFYKASGIPNNDSEAKLPQMAIDNNTYPFSIDVAQSFTSPPARYSEASLIKKLEAEGIGRPSTYASIIDTIKTRKYVEAEGKSLRVTAVGEKVTEKLIEAFPDMMNYGYTRHMESELDDIAIGKIQWQNMLSEFYMPFKTALEHATENIMHAKAEVEPAPYKCPDCGAKTVYRFGRNGRFLSCATYPDCKHASPVDSDGKPMQDEIVDVICPEDNKPMLRRKGRFGPFLAAQSYPDVKFILKLNVKTGAVELPKTPPFETNISCDKCKKPLYLRDGKRGLWLGCSAFPKCRARMAMSKISKEEQQALQKSWDKHLKKNPCPTIKTVDGKIIKDEDNYIPQKINTD